MAIFRINAVYDGLRREFTIDAYDEREAEALYYDTVTTDADELIGIDETNHHIDPFSPFEDQEACSTWVTSHFGTAAASSRPNSAG